MPIDPHYTELGKRHATLLMAAVDQDPILQSAWRDFDNPLDPENPQKLSNVLNYYTFPRILKSVSSDRQAQEAALDVKEQLTRHDLQGPVLANLQPILQQFQNGALPIDNNSVNHIMQSVAQSITAAHTNAFAPQLAGAFNTLTQINAAFTIAMTNLRNVGPWTLTAAQKQQALNTTLAELNNLKQQYEREKITLLRSQFSSAYAPALTNLDRDFYELDIQARNTVNALIVAIDDAAGNAANLGFTNEQARIIGTKITDARNSITQKQQQDTQAFIDDFWIEMRAQQAKVIDITHTTAINPVLANDQMQALLLQTSNILFHKAREGEQQKWSTVYAELGRLRKNKEEEFRLGKNCYDSAIRKHSPSYNMDNAIIGQNGQLPPFELNLDQEKIVYRNGIVCYKYGDTKMFTIEDLSIFPWKRRKQMTAMAEIMQDIYGLSSNDGIVVASGDLPAAKLSQEEIEFCFIATAMTAPVNLPVVLLMAIGVGIAHLMEFFSNSRVNEMHATLAAKGMMSTENVPAGDYQNAKANQLAQTKQFVEQHGGTAENVDPNIELTRFRPR